MSLKEGESSGWVGGENRNTKQGEERVMQPFNGTHTDRFEGKRWSE